MKSVLKHINDGRTLPFAATALVLLTLLADQISVAIENAALYDRLRRHTEELEAIVGERTAELSKALAKAQAADRLKESLAKLTKKHKSGTIALVLAQPLASVLRSIMLRDGQPPCLCLSATAGKSLWEPLEVLAV